MVIPAMYWVVCAFILAIIEIFTLTFASLWFGVSALFVALFSFLYPSLISSWKVQVMVWLIISICIMIYWFKIWQPAQEIVKKNKGIRNGKLINEQGIITNPPTKIQSGTIRFHVPISGASEWKCRPKGFEEINFGDIVTVVDIDIEKEELVVSLIKK